MVIVASLAAIAVMCLLTVLADCLVRAGAGDLPVMDALGLGIPDEDPR